MTRNTFAMLLATLALPASAQTIYKCIDANGSTLISNARVDKSCKAVVQSPETSMPAPRPKPAGSAANPTPGSFPRVQEDTQRARDTDRRRILEQEMATEQRNLEQARRDLVEIESVRNPDGSGTPPDRLQPYRDRVSQHERNITAIQKELVNLR